MKCEKCGDSIEGDAPYDFKGRKVCDDCYIDLMIGVPEVDISKLPPEVQSDYQRVMRGWNRHRPNRHHFLSFPSKSDKGTSDN
jgi:NMD protein affecting ribosome stability and mRNA decay